MKEFHPFSTPHPYLQNQSIRRSLVVFNILSVIFSLLCVFFLSQNLGTILLIPSIVIFYLLILSTRNVPNSIDLKTDERERKLRDHANRISYSILSGIIVLLIFLISLYTPFLASREAEITIKIKDVYNPKFMISILDLLLITGILPTWVFAWLEPDSLRD